jgi:ATP-dependent helicase/nuclease subunit B
MAALGRWNLEVNDSGGDTLMETPAGIFGAAGRGSGNKRTRTTDLAGAAQASAAAAWLCTERTQARHRGAGAGTCCAARGRKPAATASPADFAGFREELRKLKNNEDVYAAWR